MSTSSPSEVPASVKRYARYLLFMAGLGGLLYGMDVGIISHALPYIRQTTSYSDGDISQVVAAVLLGSVISSLFAGWLADLAGRKWMIVISSALFLLSIPVICLSGDSLGLLMGGRILMGISGGLLGVVVPLYLAECLGASDRGKGTGMFQLMLTIGLVFTALIGSAVAYFFGSATDATVPVVDKQLAWQLIFWISAIPGVILVLGALRLGESPRWLYRRGQSEKALIALCRNNTEADARQILQEMEESEESERKAREEMKNSSGDTIFQKKYIYPFVLAVVILACTQATGINSVLNYSVEVFQQAGLDSMSGVADVLIKVTNVLMTLVAMTLVDKKGRKFLLKLGTVGIIIGLLGVGGAFYSFEGDRTPVTDKVQVRDNSLSIDLGNLQTLASMGMEGAPAGTQLVLNYQQGNGTKVVVAEIGKKGGTKIEVPKLQWEEPTVIERIAPWSGRSIFNAENPAMAAGKDMELKVVKAEIGMKPSHVTGWCVAAFFIVFIAFYAVGPGVCVWLALSELMPTRIRSVGMSIGLFINQGVSTTIAGTFLPWAGSWGYSGVFFTLACFTVIYFITAAFFLPETKGRTLEEIEKYFTDGEMPPERKKEEAEA